MTEAEVKALFLLAGIEVQNLYQIANQYWPDNGHFEEERRRDPWWLVKTPAGLVKIGWRKRVISINWSDTSVRKVITEHNVTKGEDHVHAYSYGDAVTYLDELGREFKRINNDTQVAGTAGEAPPQAAA